MTSQTHWTHGDPKFWPAWIRHLALLNICFFVFMGTMYAAGLAPGFQNLAKEFRVGYPVLAHLISWSVFALGVSNVFWMPTAICFGKRPAILISMAIFLAGSIWSERATSYNSLLGARIIASFGAGSVETIGPAMIADMYMEKYFATAMAAFAIALSAGSQVGPMISGFLIQSNGWRWFFTLTSILIAINLLTCIIFLPETNFRRTLNDGETAAEADKVAIETLEYVNQADKSERTITNDSQIDAHTSRTSASGFFRDLFSFRNRGQEEGSIGEWVKQFSLPFRFIAIPAALYATCSYGIMLSGVVVISTLSTQLLSPPPYLFRASDIGLYSLSSFIGILVAFPIAGPVTDAVSAIMRRRNGGIHKPEHRMLALIFPFFVAPPGLILFAYMIAQDQSYYKSAVGYSMQATGLVLVPSVVLSYVVDSYPRSGGEALVLINAGKNLVAFGLTLSCNSWLAKEGLTKMFCELAGAQWIILAFGLPLYFTGPMLRKLTMRIVK